jgi:hypothetical protein
MPKPKALWTYDEKRKYGQASPAERAALIPTRPCLLGAWDSLPCFLPAHGHGRHPLHLFTVRDCRTHVQDVRAAAQVGRGPIRPSAWPGPDGRSALQRQEEAYQQRRPLSQHQRMSRYSPPQPGWIFFFFF